MAGRRVKIRRLLTISHSQDEICPVERRDQRAEGEADIGVPVARHIGEERRDEATAVVAIVERFDEQFACLDDAVAVIEEEGLIAGEQFVGIDA